MPLVQSGTVSTQTNPIEKVIEILSELQQKIIKEGEVAQKIYDEFAEWCEEESKNLQFEIKTGKAEADLKAATEIRDKEHADFLAEEADLVDTVDALERAIGILEREMAKTGGASFVQLRNANNVVSALQVLVDASKISSDDAHKLTAFVQSQQDSADSEFGAPDPAA